MIGVADTGPLLALAKVEALHLLPAIFQQVITGPLFIPKRLQPALQ